jgi:hypothetical protein
MALLENNGEDYEQVEIDAGEINIVQHVDEIISLDSCQSQRHGPRRSQLGRSKMFKQSNGEARHKVSAAPMTRRVVVTTAAAVPLSISAAAAEDAVADLIKGAEEKNAAFMRGDMDRWAKITRIAPRLHVDPAVWRSRQPRIRCQPQAVGRARAVLPQRQAKLQVAQTYTSERLVVLVMIEEQQAEVGGLPEQDWSLRVTEVYRKDGSEWQLAHRHADPLVRRITLEQAAALARG